MSADEFAALLASQDERPVHRWLEDHPVLLVGIFFDGSNGHRVLSELQLGQQYRADFALIYANSVSFKLHLVELQSPTARLYNQDGTEAAQLREARRQLQEWSILWRQSPDVFRQSLSLRLAREKPWENWTRGPGRWAHEAIRHPDTNIDVHYHAIIGRREGLTTMDNQRRASDLRCLEIITYDRLLDRLKTTTRATEHTQ